MAGVMGEWNWRRSASVWYYWHPMSTRERMGSGGLQGLQILMSGASGVRGGFDSHAFPPTHFMTAGAILALLLLAAPVHAQSLALPLAVTAPPWMPVLAATDSAARPPASVAGADSSQAQRGAAADSASAAAIDSSGVIEWPRKKPGEAGERRPAAQLTGFDQPHWVMLRSLVVPGWGQLHNHAWLKAIGIAALEGSMIAGLVGDERELPRLHRRVDAATDENVYFQAVDAYNARLDQSIARRWWLGAVVVYAVADAYVDAYFVRFKTEFERDPALPSGHSSGLKLSLGRTF